MKLSGAMKFASVDKDGDEGQAKYLPVEGIKNMYCFGAFDANSALYNFLGKSQISVHSEGAAANMLRNLKYYQNRGRDLSSQITQIENYSTELTLNRTMLELKFLRCSKA